MSGAAVWAAGRIVAVVAEHHPSEGTGRLTARRIDRAYEQLPEADLGQLVAWLGLPADIGGLPDVVPAGPGQLVRSAYLEQVRDIAPDALIGRDGELAEWAEFCAGAEAYAWWQAGPWAGKSALASWFVTHPPAGVDVVSFFITGRLAGQADSDAFLEAMIEQLAALAPASGGSPAVAGARAGVWLSLLASAAAQAEEQGRRLVVVVDGLDEDDAGATPARGRPSIASLLPRRPPPGVRLIVTSRPDPGLPDDVPSGHPLRTCVPRPLPVSRVAEDLARRAKQELRDLLTGDQTAIDVVGYIAASGGGLTRSDLSALTGAPPLKLDPILRGVFGRSLQTRAPADSRDADAGRRRGCTCSRMRPCGSPPRNNSATSWPATGKGSTTGSAPTPAVAGPTPRRATPYAATRACSPPPATSPGCQPSPATRAGMHSCCVRPGATTPL